MKDFQVVLVVRGKSNFGPNVLFGAHFFRNNSSNPVAGEATMECHGGRRPAAQCQSSRQKHPKL